MTTPNCTPYRDEILRHSDNGTERRPEAREQYAGCVHCMTAVTAALSGNVTGPSFDGRGAVPVRGAPRRKPAALPEAASGPWRMAARSWSGCSASGRAAVWVRRSDRPWSAPHDRTARLSSGTTQTSTRQIESFLAQLTHRSLLRALPLA